MQLTPTVADFAPNVPIIYRIVRDQYDGLTWDIDIVDSTAKSIHGYPQPITFAADELAILHHIPGLKVGTYTLRIGAPGATDPHEVVLAVGAPTVARVELVRASTYRSANFTTPCPTYFGFLDYYNGLVGSPSSDQSRRDSLIEDPDSTPPAPLVGHLMTNGVAPTPPFGIGTDAYGDLIWVAKEYAKSCCCHSVDDLYPDGYLDDRRRLEPHIPHPVTNPIDLPCIELIWNYWQEEGMLVQTLNHIVARFQNRRVSSGDPLARFDISPLLMLRSLLWAWVENEQRRLTVRRRAAEYEYEYGLSLIGRAVPARETYVERRSGFLSAFHTVLHKATVFFKELDDLTITADGFPLYEALRECHLVLSQGTQNQYGEMAIAARAEMLVMQHILAQPSMREFLGGRPMTPYPEPWMDRVDSMKAIQGWSDASVLHFHDLATFGERLVLTIRLGNWAAPMVSGPDAGNWATAFRSFIQRYIAAYRAVTGVDLEKGVDITMPSTLIARRVAETRSRA